MATKTTLRAEIRGRRRARRALPNSQTGARSSHTDQAALPARHRAEAEGIASQVRALASSMGGVTLPALFVSTPLEPDMSLALGLFPRALLPVLRNEAGAPLSEPRWGLWEAGSALATPGPPPAQPAGEALGSEALAGADLILIPALAASEDGTRLGQGGGWYDRTLLHRNPESPIVAVVFDDEVLAAGRIPREPHDVPIDAIITPTRTLHVPARHA
ncbi:5-formyltetrahydrofolate cyclo-ligase [uncultured Actinomyces sp.]|uniref:5-formyltetrahydrofolate cyclo-ligase n=1 Tax=uncultured Actinomyces sp. TaxID=249061 RepID=UPI0028E5556F|nr:5-formyltetrahydrofolate cyclo-ligase [uncultured Actinomyces sp.]